MQCTTNTQPKNVGFRWAGVMLQNRESQVYCEVHPGLQHVSRKDEQNGRAGTVPRSHHRPVRSGQRTTRRKLEHRAVGRSDPRDRFLGRGKSASRERRSKRTL